MASKLLMGRALKKTKNKIVSLFSIFLMLVFLVYSNIGFFISKNNNNSSKFKIEKTSESKSSIFQFLGDSELNEDDNTDDDDDSSSELFSFFTHHICNYYKITISPNTCHYSLLPNKAISNQQLFVLINVFRI